MTSYIRVNNPSVSQTREPQTLIPFAFGNPASRQLPLHKGAFLLFILPVDAFWERIANNLENQPPLGVAGLLF